MSKSIVTVYAEIMILREIEAKMLRGGHFDRMLRQLCVDMPRKNGGRDHHAIHLYLALEQITQTPATTDPVEAHRIVFDALVAQGFSPKRHAFPSEMEHLISLIGKDVTQ